MSQETKDISANVVCMLFTVGVIFLIAITVF